jgi:hypothetical protein
VKTGAGVVVGFTQHSSLRSARISWAAMKVATGTMPSNAPSLRIHMSE